MKYIYVTAISAAVALFLMAAVVSDAVVNRTHLVRELMNSALFDGAHIIEMSADLTAYCPGPCCNTGVIVRNGKNFPVNWSDKVAAGNFSIKRLHEHEIDIAAVDTSVIPLGSILIVDDRYYIALDVGSAIRQNRIDILKPTHEEATAFGRKEGTVRVIIPSDTHAAVMMLKDLLR